MYRSPALSIPIRRLFSFVALLFAFICCADADEPQSPAHRLIVGWDDAVIVCGPGTVAGMDSPQAITDAG